jgi:hypothetical protein
MNVRITWIGFAAIALTAMLIFLTLSTPGFAQSGPTPKDCFSVRYHASADCDRIASSQILIPQTSMAKFGPTLQDCFSARFHAASDCDRLVSDAASTGLSR